MKKSFKKAGAAVLSMAMLLSMGAMSMPVFAAPDYNINNANGATPGQVWVRINNVGGTVNPTTGVISGGVDAYKQGEGKDDTSADHDGDIGPDDDEPSSTSWKYDYLSLTNVTKAKVTMYRVAELDGANGWHWLGGLNPGASEGFNGWESLYHTDTETVGTGTAEEFDTASSQLQHLASYISGKVSAAAATPGTAVGGVTVGGTGATSIKKIGDAVIDYSNGANGAYLPTDADLEIAGTKDKIGYYILITETDQAGVIVQPVLISLKNGPENAREVSLKGTTINIDKKITKVYDTTTNYTENNDDVATVKNGNSAGQGVNKDQTASVVSDAGKSAVVAKNDTVEYEIYARLPKYDKGATPASIPDFVIEDIPSDGITIDTSSITAYLSPDDESNLAEAGRTTSASNNWILANTNGTSTGDFSVDTTAANLSAGNTNGFKFIITGTQLKAGTGTTVSDTTDHNKGQLTTMENMYLLIKFKATINEANFDKAYTAAADYYAADGTTKTLADADYAGVTVEEVREILSGQPTRYTSKSVAYSNDNLIAMTNATGENDAAKLVAAIKDITGKDDLSAGTGGLQETTNALDISEAADNTNGYYSILAGLDTTSAEFTAFATAIGISDLTTEANMTAAKKAYAYVKDLYIRAQIALDKKNATLNGENNKAEMTYGNDYSGANKTGKISTDYTKLYSVDVSFTKLTEELNLTLTENTEKVAPANILAFLYTKLNTDNAGVVDAVSAENPEGYTEIADDNADLITVLGAIYPSAGGTYGADQKTVGKKALQILNNYNAQVDDTKGYNAAYNPQPVVDAVFKLTKVYKDEDGTENDQMIDLGYAYSAADGKLYMLTKTEYTGTVPANSKYETTEGSKTYAYIPTEVSGAGVVAWKTLTIGDYYLEEIEAPVGYKKWGSPAKFTIEAEDDGTEYTGKYGATSTSYDAFRSKSSTATPVTFTYTDGTGVLSNNIYNEPYDELPATGGIGTVLFTAGGISIVLIAGALFVMYMKKRNAEDEE